LTALLGLLLLDFLHARGGVDEDDAAHGEVIAMMLSTTVK